MDSDSMKDQTMDTLKDWLRRGQIVTGDALEVDEHEMMCVSWADEDRVWNCLFSSVPPDFTTLTIVSEHGALMAAIAHDPPPGESLAKYRQSLCDNILALLKENRQLPRDGHLALFGDIDPGNDFPGMPDSLSQAVEDAVVNEWRNEIIGFKYKKRKDPCQVVVIERPSGENKMPKIWVNCDEFIYQDS